VKHKTSLSHKTKDSGRPKGKKRQYKYFTTPIHLVKKKLRANTFFTLPLL
jgi:hypothetical protein